MHFFTTTTLGLLFVAVVAVAFPAERELSAHPRKCTEENVIKRKEWSSMSAKERKAYIRAVQCLMTKPSRYDPGVVPASTSYYSDFAAAHANLSLSIHISGIFLSWHRHFVWLMEEALHNECDYPAGLGIPYWNWPDYTRLPLEYSALFDGSETSLGSNGIPLQGRQPAVLSEAEVPRFQGDLAPGTVLPLGSGGGCVFGGPFALSTVHFGTFVGQLPDDWTQPRPQCLKRDLNDWFLRMFNHGARVDAMMSARDIEQFQWRLEPIHAAGHRAVGGQMTNFFISPSDPVFYLHHGQIDRLWTLWQAENESRRYQYNGTSTIYNPVGVTPEVDNDTVITFVPVGEDVTLREVANPMSGRYCYVYV
ncbi:hypothetical protein VTO42DRAFT_4840 [Malbranchea cinnamomea]